MRLITPFVTTRSLGSNFWEDVEHFFDGVAPSHQASTFFNAATDFFETENAYALSMDLPGFKNEDIHIELKDKTLTVSGERSRKEDSDKKGNFHKSEKYYGSFKRSFVLPVQIEADKIEAHYENGVLELTLPKAPSAQARRIEVKAGKSLT